MTWLEWKVSSLKQQGHHFRWPLYIPHSDAGGVRVLSTARLVFPLAGLRLYGATLVEEWGPTELRAM